MDKELGQARKDRWEIAFSETLREEPMQVTVNRKATIVIEHLIQVSGSLTPCQQGRQVF